MTRRPRNRLRELLLVVGAAISLVVIDGVAAPSASEESMILTRDMRRGRGTLVSIDAGQVVYRDRAGSLVSVDADEVVAVLRVRRDAAPRGPVVRLSDGQRLPGRPALGPDGLRWRHGLLGTIALDPERMAEIRFDDADTLRGDQREAVEDSVLLLNGDRLDGIVAAIGSSVVLERADGTTQQVPLERVSRVTFVHQPGGAPERWPTTVWLADGSVLHAERPALGDDGILRLRPELFAPLDGTPDRPLLLPIDGVDAIRFAADRLLPLATLRPESVEVPLFRLDAPPPEVVDRSAPMGMSAVRLRGPVSVRYLLPEAGLRFVAAAMMPEEARLWGDLELVIADGEGDLFRVRLNAETPIAAIDLTVRDSELRIRVEEGRHGPVQDVVELLDALLGQSG